MAEWFKAAVLKTVDGETRPGVRIPLPPPLQLIVVVILTGTLRRWLPPHFLSGTGAWLGLITMS